MHRLRLVQNNWHPWWILQDTTRQSTHTNLYQYISIHYLKVYQSMTKSDKSTLDPHRTHGQRIIGIKYGMAHSMLNFQNISISIQKVTGAALQSAFRPKFRRACWPATLHKLSAVKKTLTVWSNYLHQSLGSEDLLPGPRTHQNPWQSFRLPRMAWTVSQQPCKDLA